MDSNSDPLIARHYYVSGLVQGVGYRYFTQSVAVRYGIRGWVRNMSDGRVEIRAEGEAEALHDFRSEIERGPFAARVSGVVQEEAAPSDTFTSFSIRG